MTGSSSMIRIFVEGWRFRSDQARSSRCSISASSTVEDLGRLGGGESLLMDQQQRLAVARGQGHQPLADPPLDGIAQLGQLVRRGLHGMGEAVEELEQGDADIAGLVQQLRLLDQGLERAADVIVADLLRAGQRPGIAPEIGQALDQLLLHDGFVGGAGFRRAVGGRAGHLDIPVEC